MTDSHTITCPKCNATAEPGSAFCTSCGARLTEKAKANPAGDLTDAASASSTPASVPETPQCGKCQTTLEPGALFCTACGTRVSAGEDTSAVGASATASGSTEASSSAGLSPPETEQQPTGAPMVASAAQSGNVTPAQSAAFATAATAAQPAYESSSTPSSSYPAPALGEAPSGRKAGPLVIVVLLLLVIVGAAVLWLRPSGTTPAGKVLILTPQRSSLAVEPNASIQLGVAVQGDGGAGVTWKIQESYGGRIEPAGVTVQGQQFVYTAAYHAGGTPGDYHVVATSLANKNSRVSITVHVER